VLRGKYLCFDIGFSGLTEHYTINIERGLSAARINLMLLEILYSQVRISRLVTTPRELSDHARLISQRVRWGSHE